MIEIHPSKRKDTAILSGKLGPAFFELVREMPGRRRWVDRTLLFETTRANIEFLKKHIPDAVWHIDRANYVEHLAKLEEDARRARLDSLPPEATKFAFKTQPRKHQLKAFMLGKDRHFFGYFLEQGLGKTKVALDEGAALWAEGKIDTLLIDAPNGVHRQWVEEQIPVHLPDFVKYKAVVYRSDNQTKTWQAQVEEVFAYQEGLRIFAVHHDAFSTKKGVEFVRRVLSSGRCYWNIDEASRKIKNPGAQRAKETMRMRGLAAYRRIMDGTPVTRGIEDLFMQLKFLSDDVHGFSSFYTYRNHFCLTRQVPGAPSGVVEIYGYKNIEELQERLDAWTVRMTAADCLDLPERTYMRIPVPMTDTQKRLYNELKEDLVTQLNNGQLVSAEQAIVKILRLQQICCGHVKTEDGELHGVPTNKPEAALSAARQVQGKSLIWARFHYDIDLLQETFKKAGYKPLVWDGRVSNDDRKLAKDRFIHDEAYHPLIANPGSAGTGTDGLQHASHNMIFYSNTFKASERWQGEARLFRDGQKGTVNVVDLVTPNSVEGHILDTLRRRQDIAFRTIDFRKEVLSLLEAA